MPNNFNAIVRPILHSMKNALDAKIKLFKIEWFEKNADVFDGFCFLLFLITFKRPALIKNTLMLELWQ